MKRCSVASTSSGAGLGVRGSSMGLPTTTRRGAWEGKQRDESQPSTHEVRSPTLAGAAHLPRHGRAPPPEHQQRRKANGAGQRVRHVPRHNVRPVHPEPKVLKLVALTEGKDRDQRGAVLQRQADKAAAPPQ